MFAFQIIIAAFIAFLALAVYDKLRTLFATGSLETKHVGSSRRHWLRTPTTSKSCPVEEIKAKKVNLFEGDDEDATELASYKRLYHKLHNLENHPEILPECRNLLLTLLSDGLSAALKDTGNGILDIDVYSRESLHKFLRAKDIETTNLWEKYLDRRKSGSPREIFSDQDEAKWWLKQATPVKYVDGAWLGHINKITTPFELRKITKNAWQVMSEELGDGDLAKNHIYVYQSLLRDIKAQLPASDSADFIKPCHGLDELRCWKAAIAQLLISLFPHDFLPEALGFNMAYESLPVHLLKTVRELRELKLNPYYFELHISIDNADSGHAAMALAAVVDYLELIANGDGPKAAMIAWKRVQAGYVLAESLPTTPESPSLRSKKTRQQRPWNDEETAVLDLFAAKAPVAHKIHCNSRLRIGRRRLTDWLDPVKFAGKQWRRDFLHDLGLCKPWIIKGDIENSRLIKELSWEGKMFGSFTQMEVEVVKSWVGSLGDKEGKLRSSPQVYYAFIGFAPGTSSEVKEKNVLVDYPCFNPVVEPQNWLAPSRGIITGLSPLSINLQKLNIKHLIPLWFASASLLESLPSIPTNAASSFGSAVVRVLRAQAGFSNEGPGVAGMDEVRRTENGEAIDIVELGLEMCSRAGLGEPKTLEEVVKVGGEEIIQMAEYMLSMGMRWLACSGWLVGMCWGFMELHELLAEWEADGVKPYLLADNSKQVLKSIARRERNGLKICKIEIEQDPERTRKFWSGVALSRRAIERCFS